MQYAHASVRRGRYFGRVLLYRSEYKATPFSSNEKTEVSFMIKLNMSLTSEAAKKNETDTILLKYNNSSYLKI
jgi:hypothetical protein